jgi:hypothetical protein
MKKIILLFVLLVSGIVANAATYRIKYDVKEKKETSFVVTLSSDKIVVGKNVFPLRRLGTITNSGLTFNSYCYGEYDKMLCVSTSSVTVGNFNKKVTGYIIMIDNKTYLADIIN